MEIIKIEGLTKTYKNIIALNNINLKIEEGKILGLFGLNGAGKSTLINILSCLLKPDFGNVSIMGFSLNEKSSIKKIINASFSEMAISSNLTVYENLKFFYDLYETNDKEYLEQIIKSFGLEKVLNQMPKTLSLGYLKRLSIAISLISKPKILFLDEPTLGLDLISRNELWNIIKKLKGKLTMILTSHYMEEMIHLCDSIAILKSGNLIFNGTLDEILEKENEKNFEKAFLKILGVEENEQIY